MEDIRTVHLKILQEHLGKIACELSQIRFHGVAAQLPWRPSINVYRCRDRIVICVELAGVERANVDVRVEPFCVWVGARRCTHTLEENRGELLHVLALEIDDGLCEREIRLPEEIVPDEVRAGQRNGLLWIDLPLRSRERTAAAPTEHSP